VAAKFVGNGIDERGPIACLARVVGRQLTRRCLCVAISTRQVVQGKHRDHRGTARALVLKSISRKTRGSFFTSAMLESQTAVGKAAAFFISAASAGGVEDADGPGPAYCRDADQSFPSQ